ncbi:MAG: hypothetical protein WC649_12235 [Desulfobacteria bacterium]
MPRTPVLEIPVAERIGNFKEVEMGFSRKIAMDEARRCLRCDIETL